MIIDGKATFERMQEKWAAADADADRLRQAAARLRQARADLRQLTAEWRAARAAVVAVTAARHQARDQLAAARAEHASLREAADLPPLGRPRVTQ